MTEGLSPPLVMHQPGVLKQLINNATEASRGTRNETLWVLANICANGNNNHVQALIQCEGLQPLMGALSLKNVGAGVLH
jgi:hypothetical protein